MITKTTTTVNEEAYEAFQSFSMKLLKAEERGFDDKLPFYSPTALSRILKEFCTIIADTLHAQSCTIQLKLHDPNASNDLKDLFTSGGHTPNEQTKMRARTTLWKDFAEDFRTRWNKLPNPHSTSDYRVALVHNPLTFPYTFYPKGAAWVVASNEGGPWEQCEGWLVTDLAQGVTAQIVQNKSARIRDRMSIQSTRDHSKFGRYDPYIWTNAKPSKDTADTETTGTDGPGNTGRLPQSGGPPPITCFFNYYGVPIRIHQGSDVIGILKVENKGLGGTTRGIRAALDYILRTPLRRGRKDVTLAPALYDRFCIAQDKVARVLIKLRDEQPLKMSLFSLAYLAIDLADARANDDTTENRTVEYYCAKAYQDVGSVDPGDDRRPPVQINFDSVKDEKAFTQLLAKRRPTEASTRTDARDAQLVFEFCRSINSSLRTRDVSPDKISKAIGDAVEAAIPKGPHKVTVTTPSPNSPRPLLHAVCVKSPEDKRVHNFAVQVTPSPKETYEPGILEERFGFRGEQAAEYRRVNTRGFETDHNTWDTHANIDRIAARIQALTFAFPLPEFSTNDSWMLSWAALEIGKLIERQISYRGTSIKPVVPLTTMDFYRVPISDLSFVDALRDQYRDGEAVEGMLRYYLPNICREMRLGTDLPCKCRVKDFRSYLERLGQEHRAYYDALLAVWLHILICSHGKDGVWPPQSEGEDSGPPASKEPTNDGENAERMWGPLRKFKELFDRTCGEKERLSSQDMAWLRDHAPTLYGDLKFNAPILACDGLAVDLTEARRRVLNNLKHCPQSCAPEATDAPLTAASIANGVLRNYDAFIEAAMAFYIVLENQILLNESESDRAQYKSIYCKLQTLVNSIADKLHEAHDVLTPPHSTNNAIKAFGKTLDDIRWIILDTRTSAFRRSLPKEIRGRDRKDDWEARLGPCGIYKRIRTVLTVSTNQVSPRRLNWESARFDYVGGRVNCQFKSQVFAVYEYLWSRGDPFIVWLPSVSDEKTNVIGNPRSNGGKGEAEAGGKAVDQSTSRVRWLCVRTKVHSGEHGYNAWQISALMDPKAVVRGHWDDTAGYNLRALRDFLTTSSEMLHPGFLELYKDKAIERGLWHQDYCKWFPLLSRVVRGEELSDAETVQAGAFRYILRTPLDVAIRVLSWLRDPALSSANRPKSHEAEAHLASFCRRLGELKRACKGNDNVAIKRAVAHMYEDAEKLANSAYSDEALKASLVAQLKPMTQERPKRLNKKDFDQLKALFGHDTVRKAVGEIGNMGGRLARKPGVVAAALRRIQCMQRHFLFELDRLRDQDNILPRIIAYVLLLDTAVAARASTDSHPQFVGWTAYDLYYYLISLVPVEIQVRTSLADAVAEQYHGIYKKTVDQDASYAVQCWRTEEIGRELDFLARELDGQYEAIVNRKADGTKA